MTMNLNEALEHLVETKRLPRLKRAESVGALMSASTDDTLRGYITGNPVRVRVSKQVDLEMDALIRDGELGSLGVIHRIDSATDVPRKIDHAAYLRHLLIEEMRTTGNANRSPYAVEVVLVVDEAGALGETLRDILRDGTYLHAIGVNLWRPENGDLTTPASVRRAFSWLLAETEQWFRQDTAKPNASSHQPLQRLELQDFRIAGRRVFDLKADQQLHILHGHNGSGKSSFSEALELIVSGRIGRLDQQDHGVCLTNHDVRDRDAKAAASVTIRRGKEEKTWGVEAAGITDPLGTMSADAFRLDQSVADRLTHSTAADRARLFLSAFFDVESQGLRRRNVLLNEARSQFVHLPPKIAEAIGKKIGDGWVLDDSRAREELQWLAEPRTMTWEKFFALMPLTKAQVHDLGAMLPLETGERFQQTGRADLEKMITAARALDEALATLVRDLTQWLDTLTNAVAVLERYGSTGVTGGMETGGDLQTLLRRWQQLHALTDLLEREEQIRLTIEDAMGRGHTFSDERQPLIKSMLTIRRDVVRELREDRDRARQRVVAFVSADERKVAAEQAAPATPVNFEALTAAADAGAFGEDLKQARPPFGQALRDALAQGRPVEVRAGSHTLHVGTSGWGVELLAQAKAVLATLTQISAARAELPAPPRTLAALLPALRDLHKSAVQIGKLDAEDVQRLDQMFADNGELGQALNELTALLTPARWAYRDVIPSADLKGTDQSLELDAYRVTNADGTTAGISARFLLNTAELNTLALSIFLLCARRVENPLHLLVLDDPLQNMDELTVTTIARGLARILRLWKKSPLDGAAPPWRIFMLLHADDDVERIRAEVPCAVYFLPWLSPCGTKDTRDTTVQPRASLLLNELQTLDAVIETPPLTSAVPHGSGQ